MKRRISIILLCFAMVLGIGLCNVGSVHAYTIKSKADDLYLKICEFLDDYGACDPEELEDACVQYILTNSDPMKFLEKEGFAESSEDALILYRGVHKKIFAENFKNGKIYIGKNAANVRGNGIYTTTDEICAKNFAESTGEIIEMLLDESATILNINDLERIKERIRLDHPGEFDFAYTSLMFDCNTWECYYGDPKEAIFRNSGLLTRMLGYDVLYTGIYDRDLVRYIEEYSVLNAGVLTVCK